MKISDAIALAKTEAAALRRWAALHDARYRQLNPRSARGLRQLERNDRDMLRKKADMLDCLIARAS